MRFILTGHDGILQVDGDLPAPIVPHSSEIHEPTCPGEPEQRALQLAMSSRLVARPNRRSCLRGREDGNRYARPKERNTAMPELLIDFITSLDGYAAADGWPGWWGLEGPEYLAWLGEQPEADYTNLMGATTYRLMSGFAPEGEPGTDALAGCRTEHGQQSHLRWSHPTARVRTDDSGWAAALGEGEQARRIKRS